MPTKLDVDSVLNNLAVRYRTHPRRASDKEWDVRTILNFRLYNDEPQYQVSWENCVLPESDLVCVLVNDSPLGNDVQELHQIEHDGLEENKLLVVWDADWVAASELGRGKGMLAHDFWLAIYLRKGLEDSAPLKLE
ncbi:hypothetical protein LTR54_017861 [Friedmanniomyces endolithicus]|uniref:Chromo domain-containing protein n=1 Tax=Friedmanniomyces endolithicus TaxID=329885 RepID=A0AAN6F4P1_9PEZI|nr:hypothetical protein LTS00_017540 [Friedmanniomyces endolithicus]KAK0303707.1 hypothetical protein LTR82_017455 [Friedmanniomyces endolithicus]KAK0822665.1 hypothetical protein LTR73_009141 [Friedmanniomyces endolithicus]KAK0971082.1 hypothetical protein LTR54_017861 [Friedmanniomyces endolithicus]